VGDADPPPGPRLTARQRCALSWRAQELTLADIATRMGVSPQAVHQLIESAGRRLTWLEMEEYGRDGRADVDPISADDFPPLSIRDFLGEPADSKIAKPVADGARLRHQWHRRTTRKTWRPPANTARPGRTWGGMTCTTHEVNAGMARTCSADSFGFTLEVCAPSR